MRKSEALPIVSCCCPACGDLSLQRQRVKRLIAQLEVEHPEVKNSMIRALGNVASRHLLDRRLNPLPELRDAALARRGAAGVAESSCRVPSNAIELADSKLRRLATGEINLMEIDLMKLVFALVRGRARAWTASAQRSSGRSLPKIPKRSAPAWCCSKAASISSTKCSIRRPGCKATCCGFRRWA